MSFTHHLTAGLTLVACSIPALAQDAPEGARGAGRQRMVAPLMQADRKSTRLNSSHIPLSRMPSSA